WVPFHRIKQIKLEAPADLRDFVWMPAELTFATGGQMVALIPTRYPGTEEQGDNAEKLARKTEWRELAPDSFAGLGQRLFATDRGEHSLMDLRKIDLDVPEAEAAPPKPEASPAGG